jgi:hypothetical protein
LGRNSLKASSRSKEFKSSGGEFQIFNSVSLLEPTLARKSVKKIISLKISNIFYLSHSKFINSLMVGNKLNISVVSNPKEATEPNHPRNIPSAN